MSPSPDVVVRQWFREVWDEGHEEAIDRLLAPHAIVHGLGPTPMTGPAAFKPIFRVFREALGDLEIEVEQTIVEGELCAAYCRVKGRHVGQALGGPPTNRPIEFTGVSMTRVQNGRIVEGWNVFDFLGMYQQIGWVKNPVLP